MSLDQVLAMTTRRFFFLVSQVPRIEAEEDLRALQVAATAQSSAIEKVGNELLALRGDIETYRTVVQTSVTDEDPNTPDPNFDREGLARLKALMG